MPSLRTFDAFPKTEQQHVKKSSKGGLTSIVIYLFLLFIAWSEFGSYFGGYIDEQYIVDDEIRTTAQINMNIYVKMPCKYLEVTARDQTGDLQIVSERLNFQDIHFRVPYGTKMTEFNDVISPDLDDILADAIPAQFTSDMPELPMIEGINFDGCSIYGSVPVNKVSGELQITAKGWTYMSTRRTPFSVLNFSHVINELSFGDFFPYIDNTLDGVGRIADEPLKAYYYFTSVLPTAYKKMGAEVHTNQYSVDAIEKSSSSHALGPTGITISYNFEALKVIIKDERIGFTQFIVRLVAILSFVVYLASLAFRFTDWTLVNLLGSKWSLRYESDKSYSKGLLE
ncbi:Erv41p Ecym_1151 [Eremothecium cymbalariae DBVPG|uniref:Endoplasmic reticulum-Golgi intermediate compartment protein n=1 Tax=Eremothecium cymbalariae (strain CBS 270.75 / DBVPG 7215 / KCTC 17166 / NRRL Y-17582) TaxID=931890 RepID=G8JMP7_ERECY|nr:hypothetical protein Ecym_1151 [Eremothecium cymbalariae DBVPG\